MSGRNLFRPVAMLAAGPLLAVLALAASAQTRIVAVGDVHGALPEFESILKQTGFLDAKRAPNSGSNSVWAGGRSILVQLGDLVDRGPQTRACLDLVMQLERSAQKQKKGKVVALLGNHEVMAMTGDLRYVLPEDYRSFANAQSEKVRQKAYSDYLAFIAGRSDLAGIGPAKPISAQEWMVAHPLGYFERRDAFGPLGVYGRWLRQHNVAHQEGAIAFVHAGLSPNAMFDDIGDLNDQMRGALQTFDREWQSLVKAGIIWRYMTMDEAVLEVQRERAAIPTREAENTKLQEELEKFIDLMTWLVSEDNPTWYRGLAEQPEQTLGPRLDAMMSRLKINAIVAGHTVMPDFQIHQRLNNRVFLIDTGMLRSEFGGTASALEIQDGRFTAHSAGQPAHDLAPQDGRAGGTAQP